MCVNRKEVTSVSRHDWNRCGGFSANIPDYHDTPRIKTHFQRALCLLRNFFSNNDNKINTTIAVFNCRSLRMHLYFWLEVNGTLSVLQPVFVGAAVNFIYIYIVVFLSRRVCIGNGTERAKKCPWKYCKCLLDSRCCLSNHFLLQFTCQPRGSHCCLLQTRRCLSTVRLQLHTNNTLVNNDGRIRPEIIIVTTASELSKKNKIK